MLEALLNPILPVFALFGVGFVLGLRQTYDVTAARAINRFVIEIGVPALVFSLIVQSRLAEFDYRLLGFYLLTEMAIYAIAALIARFVFKRSITEALLLGMSAAFCNHVFFVLPIALELYGEAATPPVIAIITMDAAILFGGTVILMEVMTGESRAPSRVLPMLAKNPMLIAISAGLLCSALGITMHPGFMTFLKFTGAAAAPASLFALGIILANANPFRPDGLAFTISVFRLIAFPVLFFAMAYGAENFGPDLPDQTKAALLVAAGPCGAMPFALAVQYKIPAGIIAKSIVYSTVMSLFTLAWIA